MDSQFQLLATRRFMPLFVVQFLGAFNDNLLKTVFVVLIAYGIWDIGDWDPAVLVAVATGVFILPFVLFCPFAGNMSDKYDKAKMIRIIKMVEILIALLAIGALYSESLYLAFGVLLALGTQSAFFSPCKFSILPQHLSAKELVGGNALVSTGTYLAILLGTIIGAFYAPLDYGLLLTSVTTVLAALAGYGAAILIPKTEPPEPEMVLSYNIIARAAGVLKSAFSQPPGVFLAIVGTAGFYFVASTFHAQFPNFTKTTLGADNMVLIVFMVLFSVGIGIGGLLNHKFLKAKADGRFVPLACVFMGVFGVDIYFVSRDFPLLENGALYTLPEFVQVASGARILVDTLLQAIACGFYVVPLRAIVQARAEAKVRSRVISASNMTDAVFILAAALMSTVLLGQGVTIEGLYLTVSVLTLGAAVFLFRQTSLKDTYKKEVA